MSPAVGQLGRKKVQGHHGAWIAPGSGQRENGEGHVAR
jgi:hypothetical protein